MLLDAPKDLEKVKEGARALVREMGALKGLVMKVGQMASYLPGALPEEAQQILNAPLRDTDGERHRFSVLAWIAFYVAQ